ncbi:MAG: AsmA family protein [Hyphomicrobium sp.]|uniref:AsmA family protein n=1 Tax=Hyphomicrobium sp. TaxID=82 RepID=UPI003D1045F1
MATDPGTPAASAAGGAAAAAALEPPSPKKRKSTAWRIVRLVLIGAVVSLALLIIFPPTGVIKDRLAKGIGTSIKRTVTIGAMRIRYWPKLDIEFDDVAVSNPAGMPARDAFRAETLKARMELLPLLKGRVRLESVALIKPAFMLEEGADGARNWVFDTEQAASATATTPAAFSLPPVSTITDGTLTFQSALTGAQRSASDIDAVQTLAPGTGALTSKGNLTAGGETVVFDAELGTFDAVVAGTTSPLKATIDARPLRASIEGDALFSAEAEFTGKLSASTTSLIGLAQWLGSDLTPTAEPIKGSLEGAVKVTTRDVTFTDTDVLVNTTNGRFNGNLDLGADRPKLAGAFESPHIDLGRVVTATRTTTSLAPTPEVEFEPLVAPSWDQLLRDLDTLEKGPAAAQAAAAAAPVETAAAAGAAPAWSEQPFNLKGLKAFDLDVKIHADDITYGALDLKQGRVAATVKEGMLDAKLEELAVGAGRAVGTLSIDSVASPPKAVLAMTMTDVAAEPIVTEITGKPILSGQSNVEITATAAGQNQSQLASTLDGKARFRMGQGSIRGFDVRRMIFEWWKSWSFDLSHKTGFTKLEAQYDIKKGIMRSEPGFELGGSEVEINSEGTVNVPKKQLNQEIRVKAIPPPTAFPIPVKITGNWTKPSIGIDWAGLFSVSPGLGLGGPQALAQSPEPPPANVQAAIRRVLALNLPEDQLSPDARHMLQSLLPAEAPAAP